MRSRFSKTFNRLQNHLKTCSFIIAVPRQKGATPQHDKVFHVLNHLKYNAEEKGFVPYLEHLKNNNYCQALALYEDKSSSLQNNESLAFKEGQGSKKHLKSLYAEVFLCMTVL